MLALRPDLEIVPAEPEEGRPAVLVHDPVSGTFDRVEWPESDILHLLRTPIRFIDLYTAFVRGSPLKPSPQETGLYITELEQRGWLTGSAFADGVFRPRKTGGLRRFLQWFAKAMFFQIPLLRPERFLRATAGIAGAAVNPLTVLLLVFCGLAGLYLALPRWEAYWADCSANLRPGGIPAIILAVIGVKALHEFAHAYAATLAGARVSAMGIAFMFCLPLPYTDVTDAWRLSWKKRFRVASAGIRAETAVAGAALLLWALSPPGEGSELFARLSSVALVSTLLTNLNPGPRFDGYYMLCCLFRMENLRPRGMGELRRTTWRRLFGIGEKIPQDAARPPGGRRHWALLYAAYAVLYRMSLGAALAVLAYSFLPKALAIPVVIVEAWLFLLAPVVVEIIRLARNWRSMRITAGLLIMLAVLASGAVWFFGAWPRRADFPGVVRAETETAVRARRSGVVREVSALRGGRVRAGDVLAVLDAPEDAPHLREAEWALREAETAEAQSWRDEGARLEVRARDAELDRRRAELAALRKREEYLAVAAPSAGVVAAWDETLVPGTPVREGVTAGWVTDGDAVVLSCYPDMETAGMLDIGSAVRFYPDSGEEAVDGTIVRMEQSRPEILEDAELAALLGAEQTGGVFVLPKPYAKVTARLEQPLSRSGQTGVARAWTRPESLAGRAIRRLGALAVRESAF